MINGNKCFIKFGPVNYVDNGFVKTMSVKPFFLSHQSGRLATTHVKDSFLQAEDYEGNALVTEDGESQ